MLLDETEIQTPVIVDGDIGDAGDHWPDDKLSNISERYVVLHEHQTDMYRYPINGGQSPANAVHSGAWPCRQSYNGQQSEPNDDHSCPDAQKPVYNG